MASDPDITNVLAAYSISFYDVHGCVGWSDSKQWIDFSCENWLPFEASAHVLMTILQVWYQTQLPVILYSQFLKNAFSATEIER